MHTFYDNNTRLMSYFYCHFCFFFSFFSVGISGLDSVTSKQCIRFLKRLALEGRTIICTIHQPSASLFNMIDHLYIVAEGYCVYTGGTRNLVPYLSSLGLRCPTHYNPADFSKYLSIVYNHNL